MGGGGGLGGVLNGAASVMTLGASDVLQGNSLGSGALNALGGAPDLGQMLGSKNGFGASGAPLQMPTTNQMATDQYGNVQSSLDQQQAFVNALQAQNGIGNQNQAFQMAQNQANGVGPNPAQAMLAQSTGANVAQQAALMAGQRGSGANAGLMARQAGMAGANIQQQGVGQAATMQAQQQLAGQQQMANIAAQQIGNQAAATSQYGAQAQNAYGQVSGNITGQNNANVGMQNGINAANAGVAEGNANRSGQLAGNILGGIGAAFGLAHGGEVPHYDEGGGVWDTIKSAFDEPKPSPTPKGAKPVPTPDPDKAKAFIRGGNFAEGGGIPPIQLHAMGPQSNVGQMFADPNYTMPKADMGSGDSFKTIGKAIGNMDFSSAPTGQIAGGAGDMDYSSMGTMFAAEGGKVPAMVSPGETYLDPKEK